MKFDNQKILIAIVVITLLLFPVVAFTTGPLRIALGLLFVIFFPGYTLLSALFPKRDGLSGVERLALSFGVSIAVVPLIGLILNYTPWGIELYPILISITLFVMVTSAVGWYRQRRLPPPERFSVIFKPSSPNWAGMSKLDRGLAISLIVAIVAALGCLGYAVAMPKQGEKFTEFYILNVEGKAENYPRQVILGDSAEVVIGVINHEYQPTSYRVKITIDGIKCREINMGTLAYEEKREERVSFIPQLAGEKQKVEFHLYKNGEDKPYFEDPLRLHVDVVTFYVLNAEGKAEEYPQQLKKGEPVELIVGIVNDKYQPTSYRVEIKMDDTLYKEISTEPLSHRDKWEERISFIPWSWGKEQKVEFWLYKNGEDEPYYKKPLYFYIDVISPSWTVRHLQCEALAPPSDFKMSHYIGR